jgi:hypothetical protein
MAIIPQKNLFVWENEINDDLRDLERLELVLEVIPDEELMITLEQERKNGRDDFPIRAMWNGIMAAIIFQHTSQESFLRELNRNIQLRCVCGFHWGKVPESYNYTRFLKKLLQHQEEIDKIFKRLVSELSELLPDFGERLAEDSKCISSFAKRKNKKTKRDGRRDLDANLGIKKYSGVHKDGTMWEKVVKCFGYKLHLIVDSTYELPVAYSVTQASKSDVVEGEKLLEELDRQMPKMIERCEYLSADKGYDSTQFMQRLYDKGIHPIIDTRTLWKDEKERLVFNERENIYYKETGEVYCYEPESGTKHLMKNNGYEKERHCLRKACPAKKMGIHCANMNSCDCKTGIRIPIERDKRIFTSIDRSSYKWKREYKKRTAVERVNSRLDVSFGFENHTIRGKGKMQSRCSMALIVMLAFAVGRIKQKHPELMRSLVRTA